MNAAYLAALPLLAALAVGKAKGSSAKPRTVDPTKLTRDKLIMDIAIATGAGQKDVVLKTRHLNHAAMVGLWEMSHTDSSEGSSAKAPWLTTAAENLRSMKIALKKLRERPSSRIEFDTIGTLAVDVRMDMLATKSERKQADSIEKEAIKLFDKASPSYASRRHSGSFAKVAFQAGDIVRYTAAFLRSTGQYASNRINGKVVSVRPPGGWFGGSPEVIWNDDPTETPQLVLAVNLEIDPKVKRGSKAAKSVSKARMLSDIARLTGEPEREVRDAIKQTADDKRISYDDAIRSMWETATWSEHKGSRAKAAKPRGSSDKPGRFTVDMNSSTITVTSKYGEQRFDNKYGRGSQIVKGEDYFEVLSVNDNLPYVGLASFGWDWNNQEFYEHGEVYLQGHQVEEALGPRGTDLSESVMLKKLRQYIQ